MPPMTIHPITITGEPVLHTRAEPVTEFDVGLRTLIEDMYATQEAAHGVGLAAPQIGVGLRIYTWSMANDDGVPTLGHVINPYVKAAKPVVGEPDRDNESEGCLSVPGYSFPFVVGRAPRSPAMTGTARRSPSPPPAGSPAACSTSTTTSTASSTSTD